MSNFITDGSGIIVISSQHFYSNGSGVNNYIVLSTLKDKDPDKEKGTKFLVVDYFEKGAVKPLRPKGDVIFINGLLKLKWSKANNGEWKDSVVIEAFTIKEIHRDGSIPQEV